MSEERFLRLERARGGSLARLRIHLPPVNVLGVRDLAKMAAAIEEARDARVLVLSGLPRAFSAGVEVAEHEPERERIETMLSAMRRLLTALVETPAVTVAAVAGACLGGGAEIAAACDIVFAAEDARVGFPEIRLACFPPGAVALLPARMGETRAALWILTGETFSGRQAFEAGFATRALSASALERETELLTRALLDRGVGALSAARDLLRHTRREALQKVLPRAEEAYRGLAGDEDLARAVREFKAGKR
ncbi:MAG TPA: enoyl-CoA hydratase/isomerase family protein [Thermoanaerobaculia bacterium]|nr:enoyl-CoA hydratase/isomerase family protein [Thermoanaerobaculia bacterium]